MDQLTPSELVFLHGERFATRAIAGNVSLPLSDRAVATDQLATAVLTAAFLANEEEGAIRFEMGETARWLGLRKRTALSVATNGPAPMWPDHTLEWAVSTFLGGMEGETGTADPILVAALVDALFDGDETDPWRYVIELVEDGLAARGLLDRRRERWLRLPTGRTEYGLTGELERLAADSSPEKIERLFSAVETARPELWKLLRWELERAVAARLDTSSYYVYHGSS
ncbi:hypothetical protein [Natronorarus salvus]|uniref:hypothetical protein n=1 Tax=Natronorarus salvus TaxID=3117733 RepID=UPI002F25EF23